jgi:hypothetical protein
MTEDPALLAAGYALGTLTPDELVAYREYLSSSAEGRAEAHEFAAVTDALAHEAAPVTPPPALKSTLMAKIAATPQLPAPAADPVPESEAAPAAPPAAAPVPRAAPVASEGARAPIVGPAEARARSRWFHRPAAIVASAAAAALIFVGGTFVGVGFGAGNDAVEQQASALAQLNQAPDTQRTSAPVAGGGTATLVFSRSLGKSALLVDDLDTLPSGKTYELWYIGSKGATPAGTMQAAGSGTTWRILKGRFTPGLTVGVTVEPEGGSKQPTTKPLVAIKS